MATVYVKEQGSTIRHDGERLLVEKKGRSLMTIPLVHLDQLIIMGNVNLTPPARRLLLQKAVDVIFTSIYGVDRGRLVPSKEGQLSCRRRTQLERSLDPLFGLKVGMSIVNAKVNNQRVLLQRRVTQVSAGKRGEVQRAVDGMYRMLKRVDHAKSLDALRGYEGKAAAYYFRAFQAILPEKSGFKGRAFYPPPDPVNALLSFGYGRLRVDMHAATTQAGLDPYIGFFHELADRRTSLVLDLMEEFRPVLVDPVVLEIVNKGMLREGDFILTGDPKRPVRLSNKAVEVLITQYERRLDGAVFHPLAGGQTTYRHTLGYQARMMARVIEGKDSEYQAIMIK